MMIIASILLNALVVFVVAKLVPGIVVKNYGTAVGVAMVYGFLLWALKGVLLFISFPLVVLSLGLFSLVLNGLLLWLTDKLIDSFEIKGFGPLAVGTVLITVGRMIVHLVLRQ
jgi:putative membrane protein